jgi:C-terminal processing protease CtpA/Prc
MGSYYFNDIVVGATLEAGGTEIREDAGTIGAELLMRFNWVLDFDNNTAYLKPNKFFGQEQALDRSGIWLIEGENGEKIIYKILKNSPGEQAGFQEGMSIESIDGINANSISLFELTQILKQEDGTRVTIAVKDADSTVIVELKSMI